jgi:hypothetical protein
MPDFVFSLNRRLQLSTAQPQGPHHRIRRLLDSFQRDHKLAVSRRHILAALTTAKTNETNEPERCVTDAEKELNWLRKITLHNALLHSCYFTFVVITET